MFGNKLFVCSNTSWLSNGNIGIGTTNPLYPLSVVGGIEVQSNPITFNSSGYVGWKAAQISAITDPGSNFQGDLAFSTNPGGSVGASTEKMRILYNGNVWIGTTSPQATLSVKGNTLPTNQWSGYSSSLQVGELMIQDYGIVPQVGIEQNTYYDGVASKYILNGYASVMYMGANGNITFSVYNSGTSGNAVSGTGLAMIIANSGNVGIGTTDPGNYELAVKGAMHTQSVQVDMTGWSDYVFKPSYSLALLADVKTYIDKNHHLPEIPSATEVAQNGINLGEMNAKLLKKIEELTLYLIDLKNENDALSKRVKK